MSIIDRLRTRSARFITGRGIGGRELRIRAWAWLCAHTEDLDEKLHCLSAILELDPDREWAQLARLGMEQRKAGLN